MRAELHRLISPQPVGASAFRLGACSTAPPTTPNFAAEPLQADFTRVHRLRLVANASRKSDPKRFAADPPDGAWRTSVQEDRNDSAGRRGTGPLHI
jgi:hypothetical protein